MKLVIAFTVLALMTSCKSQKEAVTTYEAATPLESREGRQGGKTKEGRQGPPSVEEVFKMDTNGDGLLAKSEVKGRLAENFDTADTNKDGYISKEEFENMPRPKRGQRPPKG